MINEKIIIALDFDTADAAFKLVNELGEDAIFYKVGIGLFTKGGPEIVKELVRLGKRIFLDLKFFDIPNSMILASKAGIDLGVSIINYHCMAGEKALREVADKIGDYCKEKNLNKPLLIGVSVLTSVENTGDTFEQVIKLAGIAKDACLDGVVCSALEINAIKQRYGNDFKVIVPGIRMPDNELDDQKRAATPRYAFSQGADYIVVGRPIIKAPSPTSAFQRIIKDIEDMP